jgi:tetratricopeptide (TPR) repeat protein
VEVPRSCGAGGASDVRARATRRLAAIAAALLFSLASACSCGSSEETPPTQADTLARERAVAFYANNQNELARQELAPLVARKEARLDDLTAAAKLEFAENKTAACEALLARAAKLDSKSPDLAYMRGQIAREAGDFKGAKPFLESAHERAPDDLPTMLALADVEKQLGNVARAEDLFRSVIRVGIENGGNWYVAAVYQMMRLLVETHREAESQPFNDVWAALQQRDIRLANSQTLHLGNLGRLQPPHPRESVVEKPAAPAPYTARAVVLPELANARVLLAPDVDGDGRIDLVAYGPKGLAVALQRDKGFETKVVTTDPVDLVCTIDVDNDSKAGSSLLSFFIVQKEKLALWHCERETLTWKPSAITLPELPSPPSDMIAVDMDHEGDLDLLLVGPFGARLWRNDGAAIPDKGGTFTDVTSTATLPTDRAFEWCITEDFDGDNDVDFLLGGKSALFLADSLRAEKFADKTARVFGAGTLIPVKPIVADLDGDARPDLWTPTAIWHQERDGKMTRSTHGAAVVIPPGTLNAIDLDLDGSLDVVWGDPTGFARARLAVGMPNETEVLLEADPKQSLSGPMVAAAFERGGSSRGGEAIGLAFSASDGIHLFDAASTENHGKRLVFSGLRDNRRAIGAIVEYRAGSVYRRIYWRGEPLVVGVGKAPKLDVLRITWPNGVVQTDLDLDLLPHSGVDDIDAAFGKMTQSSGQVGSCPFLYAWNGERFTFVSDVLGITPLGLPIGPGAPGTNERYMMVPPDHDEFVLVRGDQLRARDGFFELAFTEELREVTYLDRAQLIAVDHPRGTEIYPNERFTFPPFPEAHTHTVRDPIAPSSAIGSDGRDWTKALAAIDDVHAVPFVLEPEQFAGMCKPWFVELSFDKARVASAKKLRLLMTGWLFWSDASANMASARHPGVAFVPPILQVPDGHGDKGGWRDTGPPVGFPAGKTKTMVIDVTDLLSRDDPRLRVFSTLRLYWDSIRLATDGDDAELDVHALEPTSANLWRRGFSAPLANTDSTDAPEHRPERFDWNVLASEPRWNQHPGMYTRYGECVPLVRTVDDQLVILGAGDALTLRFDAHELPAPRAGFTRDFLVFLDGWAKDRDPNTLEALEVEPLPFHAMSGYPYRADEHFPDDEAHKSWRAQWNTRPGHPWIAPISPRREAEWLLGD